MGKTFEEIWEKFTTPCEDTMKIRFRQAIAASVEAILPEIITGKPLKIMPKGGKEFREGWLEGATDILTKTKANAAAFLETNLKGGE